MRIIWGTDNINAQQAMVAEITGSKQEANDVGPVAMMKK
jgi:hypothetical protein